MISLFSNSPSWSTSAAQDQLQAIFRFCHQAMVWVMFVVWGDGKVESPKHHGDYNLCFHHCKVLSYAAFRPNGKRHECLWIGARLGNAILKSFRVEFVHILTPNLWILVERCKRDFHHQPLWDEEVAYMHIFCCNFGDRGYDRVHSHGFIQNHSNLSRPRASQ